MQQQRVVLVTGGVRGIGRAIVQQCIDANDTVWVIDKVASTDPLVAQLPSSVTYQSVDICQKEAVEQVAAQLLEKHGRLDVLINNAGMTKDALAVRLKQDDWQRVIDVNMSGSFWCAQAALTIMVRQRSGVIINMSSVVASAGNPGQVNYAASKAGIEAMTKTLAREYGARGIRVNAVAPGFITTPMTDALPATVREQAIERISLRRAGTAGEVADLILFLCSEKACYITGQIIHINGGIW